MPESKKNKFYKAILAAVVYIFAICYMFPVIIAVLNSFKEKREILISAVSLPSSLYLENYKTVILKADFFKVFFNSIALTVSSIVLIIIISAMAGYAIARWRRKVANVIMLIFLSAMFVPFHTVMITLLKTAKDLGATGNFPGLVLIYGALMCPTSIFLFRGFVKSIPIELEESGIIDGCNIFNLALRIVFPLMKPISATVAVINALWIWNDFLLPYLILAKPLTIPLSQMYFYGKYNQQWHLIMAGFVISTIPIVVFFFSMQKFIIKGLVSGAIKN
ncbi:MAG TPA: carbohydrate ABC transporter permease [Clostridiaceae bacterium]|nr:carbohydrate ABC transporter permease [Clostridiaceae bacterium]